MHFLLLVDLVILSSPLVSSLAKTKPEDWEKFKVKHHKHYKNKTEDTFRRSCYTRNAELVDHFNKETDQGLHSFYLGLNDYSDMLYDEFVLRMTGLGVNMLASGTSGADGTIEYDPDEELPERVDWREKGWVTPIKNQGSCGSCWAYSANAALESQYLNTTGEEMNLSEQQHVDCAGAQGNQGCQGGWMNWAFEHIKLNGVVGEDTYPYTGREGRCRYNSRRTIATLSRYYNVKVDDEMALKRALAKYGPVCVAMNANYLFQLYRGGIFDDPTCGPLLNHGILAVGYGSENGTDYWVIKNSWGTSWGEDGYGRMARNKGNQCGIARVASFPLI